MQLLLHFATVYARSGANEGLYRVADDTSATVHTWDHAMMEDIAIGDTFVKVFAKQGWGHTQFDAFGLYVNNGATVTSYYGIFVESLDLRVAGEESLTFRFGANHCGGTHAA